MITLLSNSEIEKELGKRIKARRIDRQLSQADVAEHSGLSRRTITSIENGGGSTLSTLIAVLRALNSLETLDGFLPDPGPSPMDAIKLREQPRKYAYKPRKPTKENPWKWGDER